MQTTHYRVETSSHVHFVDATDIQIHGLHAVFLRAERVIAVFNEVISIVDDEENIKSVPNRNFGYRNVRGPERSAIPLASSE